MSSFYVTTAIPYVNGEPHVGFALEIVQADALARHRRLRGDDVRFLTGTDDNALKNVRVAEAAGVPVEELVARNGDRFAALRETLRLSNDDFIRTSVDPRHAPGVERLWRACADDLYQREYEGLYCVRCESFVDGDHGHRELERVSERNWFFRLSRYEDALLQLVASGRLRIEPDVRRNEVLALIRGGLDDFSVSRTRERAHGWGLPVPDDPGQIVYVWFDALANYVTALGYGTDDALFDRYWTRGDSRLHTIGKDIVRFHAVYWPAILLSAGLEPPTAIWVHDFVTARGSRLSKSAGAPSLDGAVARLGVDALRWWLLRAPRPGADVDFREDLAAELANAELANTIGNLVSRTAALVARHGSGEEPAPDGTLAAQVDAALERFDFRSALDAILAVATEANRLVERARPWEPSPGRPQTLAQLLAACRSVGRELAPFVPDTAARIERALAGGDRVVFARRR